MDVDYTTIPNCQNASNQTSKIYAFYCMFIPQVKISFKNLKLLTERTDSYLTILNQNTNTRHILLILLDIKEKKKRIFGQLNKNSKWFIRERKVHYHHILMPEENRVIYLWCSIKMKCDLGTLYPVKLNVNFKGHTGLSMCKTSGNSVVMSHSEESMIAEWVSFSQITRGILTEELVVNINHIITCKTKI